MNKFKVGDCVSTNDFSKGTIVEIGEHFIRVEYQTNNIKIYLPYKPEELRLVRFNNNF